METSTSIALNVSRARLQVLGFVLTIDIFARGIFLRNIDLHISTRILNEVSFFFGLTFSLCLGTVAAILMLLSQRFDPTGNSDVSIFAFAEMTMYVAITQAIGGIFNGFVSLFEVGLSGSAVTEHAAPQGLTLLISAGGYFNHLVFWAISLAWAFMAYVAPLWSVSRLPSSPQRKRLYLGYYFLLSGAVAAVFAYAMYIQFLAHGDSANPLRLFFQSLWAPSLWGIFTTGS